MVVHKKVTYSCLESFQIGRQNWIRNSCFLLNSFEHFRIIGHLWNPFRTNETKRKFTLCNSEHKLYSCSLFYLVTSIVFNPVFDSRLISSILTLAGSFFGSFCNPSLGPTSTILTSIGLFVGLTAAADKNL